MKMCLISYLRGGLWVIQILLLIPIGWFAWHILTPRRYTSPSAKRILLPLSSGPFEILYYRTSHPKGTMIIASGDGGWSDQWEEPVAEHLAAAGYAVGGWDCRKFADPRGIFDQKTLVEGFQAAADLVRTQAGLPPDSPVWYVGWSTGADWSLTAASAPERSPHLQGVLAVAPGRRSRYGITTVDLLGKVPNGEGSFPLTDLASGLAGIPVVQFAGELDPLDDTSLIDRLGPDTPHKLVIIPGVSHDMARANPRFLSELDMGIQWIIDHPAPQS